MPYYGANGSLSFPTRFAVLLRLVLLCLHSDPELLDTKNLEHEAYALQHKASSLFPSVLVIGACDRKVTSPTPETKEEFPKMESVVAKKSVRSVLHTTDIVTYLTPFQNGCQILHTRAGCFFLRLPFNVALVISNCSAIFVSIERLIATLKTKTYEHGYKNIGYTLMLLQVLVGSTLLSVIYSQTKINQNPLYYCQTTSTSNFMWTIYPFSVMFIMQLLAVTIFKVAYKKNRRYSTVGGNLSCRYQNEENSWTIKSLKVYVYTNAIFTATYLTAVGLVIYNNHLFAVPTYYALVDGSSLQYLYALVLPLVLWYHRKNVQNQIRSAVDLSLHMDYNKVFDALRNQWSQGSSKTDRPIPRISIH
nr:7TM GPCR domain containing protein [Haemonchus contortus]